MIIIGDTMIESSQEKKHLFYVIVMLLTLIVMLIGATLAYYRFVASQKEDSTVLYTGTLRIEYINGVKIANPELFPLKSVNYYTTQNVYRNNFSVVSTGTLDQTIAINMVITTNTFAANSLKYALYNQNGERLNTGTVPTEGTINLADNMYLEHGESAYYTVIIWWDNTNYDQTSELKSGDRTISGHMSIYAKQVRY